MISTKKIIGMARKWQKNTAIGRKRITSSKTRDMMTVKKPAGVGKVHFVVYTTDRRRFVIPLAYLPNSIFLELLKMSEEKFGPSSDGPILLPCDSVFMNYIVLLIERGLDKDLEKVVLNPLDTYNCSSHGTTFFHEAHVYQHSLVSGF